MTTAALLTCHITKSGSIMTPRGRGWFVAIAEKFKKRNAKPDDLGAYIMTLVLPPEANIDLIKEAVKKKAQEKWGDKMPGNLKLPYKKCKDVFTDSGDAKYPPELAECYQLTANTYKQQPGIADARQNSVGGLLQDETPEERQQRIKDECYSGRHYRMTVQPSWFDNESRGVKLYLQNIQLLDHGDVIGGRAAKAEEDFTPVEGMPDAAATTAAAATKTPATADSIFD